MNVLFFSPLLPTEGETKVVFTNNKRLRCSGSREKKTKEGGGGRGEGHCGGVCYEIVPKSTVFDQWLCVFF